MSIVRTWILQWFLAKKLFLFFKSNFTRINHCNFIHCKSHLKLFLGYLPCIVCREYFSIIFNVRKCALYLIKYSELPQNFISVKQKGTILFYLPILRSLRCQCWDCRHWIVSLPDNYFLHGEEIASLGWRETSLGVTECSIKIVFVYSRTVHSQLVL